MYSCQNGWTGSKCNETVCSNTLRILDENNLTLINVECSGNGNCKASKCECDINWTSDYCEIYENNLCDPNYGTS